MKAITCAVIALVCVVGLVVADYGYGSYGASYIPLNVGAGGKGGLGQGGLLMFLGLLFLLMFLFNPLGQQQTSSVSVVDLTD